MKDNYRYRIITSEFKIKYAGTGLDSWLTLEDAKSKREEGEMVYEYDEKGERLWEIL